MKTENNHTNIISTSDNVSPGATAMKTTLWTKTKSLVKLSLPAIAGMMWGAVIVSVFLLFTLVSVISSRQGECDAVGEVAKVRSEYRRSTGCNLMIDGKWTPTSELTFRVEK
jgi:hypothetical protein